MTLLQWGWFKRWSSTSRINDALYKCDALCSFLLLFKCCCFNHGNGLKILLTSAENLLYLDHVLWLESLSLPMNTILIMSSKMVSICFTLVFLLSLSFSFTFDTEDLFFFLLTSSFYPWCLSDNMSFHVAYESGLWHFFHCI